MPAHTHTHRHTDIHSHRHTLTQTHTHTHTQTHMIADTHTLPGTVRVNPGDKTRNNPNIINVMDANVVTLRM